jgi:pimeloyl-ACP methyl ester carboxylesterase
LPGARLAPEQISVFERRATHICREFVPRIVAAPDLGTALVVRREMRFRLAALASPTDREQRIVFGHWLASLELSEAADASGDRERANRLDIVAQRGATALGVQEAVDCRTPRTRLNDPKRGCLLASRDAPSFRVTSCAVHVDVKGTRLWFDVDGTASVPDGSDMRERPTVVLLHGGPGSFDHSYFKPDFAGLAQAAQVVYLDLPGHGRSEWGDPAAWSFELCADAVRDFCDAVGIAEPVVYGHSLGGFVALAYAVRHPGHAGALVLQSTHARFDLGRIVEGFRRAGGDEVAAIAERAYGGDGRSVDPEDWARCWRLFGPRVPTAEERARTVVNGELNACGLERMRGFDVIDQLARVDCPTLVCVGELDPVTPVAAAREIVDALPEGSARLEVVKEAGHFTWKDAPDHYWPLVTEFITSTTGVAQ